MKEPYNIVPVFALAFGTIVLGWALCRLPMTPPSALSSTLYLPRIVHVPVDSCKTMFPPAEVGPLCEFYDGINLPDDCAAGYHLEAQTVIPAGGLGREEARASASGVRKVCHLDTSRGERGLGLDCANPKGTP